MLRRCARSPRSPHPLEWGSAEPHQPWYGTAGACVWAASSLSASMARLCADAPPPSATSCIGVVPPSLGSLTNPSPSLSCPESCAELDPPAGGCINASAVTASCVSVVSCVLSAASCAASPNPRMPLVPRRSSRLSSCRHCRPPPPPRRLRPTHRGHSARSVLPVRPCPCVPWSSSRRPVSACVVGACCGAGPGTSGICSCLVRPSRFWMRLHSTSTEASVCIL